MIFPKDKKLNLHAEYLSYQTEWLKYRRCYEGGPEFVNQYLKKFTNEEKVGDFNRRKELTYAPGHAAAALNEVKDAIFQRIADVKRYTEVDSFKDAIAGNNGGVDLAGSSMNTFIGEKLLLELLLIKKIGVLVDSPQDVGQTLADSKNKRPYLIYFKAENIINWYPRDPVNGFRELLLRERFDRFDDLGCFQESEDRYRYYRKLNNGKVECHLYDKDKNFTGEKYVLNIPQIPFHVFEIPVSLMRRVVDMEITLMNIESSDVSYCLTSNFPMFYEQFDEVSEQILTKLMKETGSDTVNEATAKANLGMAKGRRYSTDINMKPGFINPSSSVLEVSMKKGDKIKEDIRRVVNLNLLTATNKDSLEASLSHIGLIFENGENKIANYWAMFERSKDKQTKVSYPATYDLRTDEERRDEASKLLDLRNKIQNTTFRREITKEIVRILLGPCISEEKFEIISEEIDKQNSFPASPDVLVKAIQHYAITAEAAAVGLGFPEEVGTKATQQRIENATRISQAQGNQTGSNRGVPEIDDLDDDDRRGEPSRGEQSVRNDE